MSQIREDADCGKKLEASTSDEERIRYAFRKISTISFPITTEDEGISIQCQIGADVNSTMEIEASSSCFQEIPLQGQFPGSSHNRPIQHEGISNTHEHDKDINPGRQVYISMLEEQVKMLQDQLSEYYSMQEELEHMKLVCQRQEDEIIKLKFEVAAVREKEDHHILRIRRLMKEKGKNTMASHVA